MTKPESLSLVYCVTSFGKIIGTYANFDDAAQITKTTVAKGRLAELVPQPIIYILNANQNV